MTMQQHQVPHAPPLVGQAGRSTNRMERVIEAVANGLGSGVGWLASSGALFAIFAVLWVAFGAHRPKPTLS